MGSAKATAAISATSSPWLANRQGIKLLYFPRLHSCRTFRSPDRSLYSLIRSSPRMRVRRTEVSSCHCYRLRYACGQGPEQCSWAVLLQEALAGIEVALIPLGFLAGFAHAHGQATLAALAVPSRAPDSLPVQPSSDWLPGPSRRRFLLYSYSLSSISERWPCIPWLSSG